MRVVILSPSWKTRELRMATMDHMSGPDITAKLNCGPGEPQARGGGQPAGDSWRSRGELARRAPSAVHGNRGEPLGAGWWCQPAGAPCAGLRLAGRRRGSRRRPGWLGSRIPASCGGGRGGEQTRRVRRRSNPRAEPTNTASPACPGGDARRAACSTVRRTGKGSRRPAQPSRSHVVHAFLAVHKVSCRHTAARQALSASDVGSGPAGRRYESYRASSALSRAGSLREKSTMSLTSQKKW
jgi:hypothetical protein